MLTRQEHSSLRQGLVGAWCPSLGASGYTLIDRSGRNNHGTLTNMGGQDNWRASRSGVALNFDGTNDVVSVPASPAMLSVVWFSMWFRFTSSLTPATTQYALFSTNVETSSPYRQTMTVGINLMAGGASNGLGRLCVLTYDSGNAVQLSGAYTTQDFSSSSGVWYHASGGWDGSAWRLFVNGKEDTNAEGTQRASVSTVPVTPCLIGAQPPFGRATPMLCDDIRFYSRALTHAEIRLLASRRGIGLSPLPDRGAALPRRFSVNVGGDWRSADSYVNVGGVWRLGQPSVNVGGTWK